MRPKYIDGRRCEVDYIRTGVRTRPSELAVGEFFITSRTSSTWSEWTHYCLMMVTDVTDRRIKATAVQVLACADVAPLDIRKLAQQNLGKAYDWNNVSGYVHRIFKGRLLETRYAEHGLKFWTEDVNINHATGLSEVPTEKESKSMANTISTVRVRKGYIGQVISEQRIDGIHSILWETRPISPSKETAQAHKKAQERAAHLAKQALIKAEFKVFEGLK